MKLLWGPGAGGRGVDMRAGDGITQTPVSKIKKWNAYFEFIPVFF